MSSRPNTASVIAGLKDFQRATVEHVCKRLYGPDPTQRFLVADEVGLGKTLVARGVIARTIEHLWDTDVPRIDVIYICSNADIANQNVGRLSIRDCDVARATRLTLLPLQMSEMGKNRVNFVLLTPGTSFEQDAGGGRIDERVLLYWLLDRAWEIDGPVASLYVMQDYANTKRFKQAVEGFDPKKINEQLAIAFVSKLKEEVKTSQETGEPDLRSRFEELRRTFCRSDSPSESSDATKLRTRWIGELRGLLAQVCLKALNPSLIILDEFQRFRHLLEQETEAGELAHQLFDSDAGHNARVLLLSATPYRGLSLHHEAEEDHYGDFISLLGFLEGGNADGCKEILAEYGDALKDVRTPDGLERIRRAKDKIQERLRRVMARTERLSAASQREGMLRDAPPADAKLHACDVRAFLGAQKIADKLEQGDIVEYWKSAPYLFNFMDSYELKRTFKDKLVDRETIELVRKSPETFLNLQNAREYRPIESANPRLRGLLAETVERGMWRLLWMPPTLSYYSLEGPFASPKLNGVTKRLVFSAWHMVPRAVAALLSYEAERLMMRSQKPRGSVTQEHWKKQRGLLRFSVSKTGSRTPELEERLTGLRLMLLVYPCLTFARDFDPRVLSRSETISAGEAQKRFANLLRGAVERLGIESSSDGSADERWYWLAPMLLDFAEFPRESLQWWQRRDLAQVWADAENSEEDAAWPRHVKEVQETLFAVNDSRRLGPQPDDLFDVLALAASAAPANAALRTYMRVSGIPLANSMPVRDQAAQTGRAFLTLFNHAEVIEMIRGEFPRGEPYWQRVLEYSHAGGLQAVLNEYVHLLKQSLGVAAEPPAEMVEKISAEIVGAVTLRTASLRLDEITAPAYERQVKIKNESMHMRFAMRFGDERNDEELVASYGGATSGTRKDRVRGAFNSPFWPFVLVSTSVGQEGLDFHHYCHAVTHWNLPSNPVDLEQREGRVQRYKGHAVRKNLASAYAAEALRREASDAWESLFALGCEKRMAGENDLVPYWLFPGDAKIERHVPALPFSREVERLHGLRHALALYRMVFGQNRQEDLLIYLLAQIPEREHMAMMAELQIDLSPPAIQ